jgi:hypothetical protein
MMGEPWWYWALFALVCLVAVAPLIDWWLGKRAIRQRRAFKRYMQGRRP